MPCKIKHGLWAGCGGARCSPNNIKEVLWAKVEVEHFVLHDDPRGLSIFLSLKGGAVGEMGGSDKIVKERVNDIRGMASVHVGVHSIGVK